MPKDFSAMRAIRFIREHVTLKDGRRVLIRPIRAEDAELLMDLHDRLSSETQYLRFFGPKPSLTRPEAEYLARVDFTDRFAIVAVAPETDGVDRIVAVGRFDVVETGVAEPAIVVRDDYQSTGLGRAVLERMVEVARGRGIGYFQAEVLAENDKMLQILKANGLEIGTPRDGIVHVKAPVEDVPLAFRLATTLMRSGERLVQATDALRRMRTPPPDEQD